MRRSLSAAAAVALVSTALLVPSPTAVAGGQPAGVCADVKEPSGTFMSANVTLKCSLPMPGVIGARFKRYGDKTYMFVTGGIGLSVYNVTKPLAPKLAGTLVLPHFENEDVDLGGNILMISNDAAESRGLLYLIDISDPTDPKALYEPPLPPNYPFDMGGLAGLGGPGHTASCINGCDFAWVTNGGGIDVYDLRGAKSGDETPPQFLGNFQPEVGGLATHDVQKDGNGLYWIAGFNGTAAYRVPKSANYDDVDKAVQVAKTDEDGVSTYLEELGLGDGRKPNDYIHHNSLRQKDGNVVYITEEDYTRPGCRGAGSFQTWKLPLKANGKPNPNKEMKFMDQWETELLADQFALAGVCSAHYFDISKKLVAQGWYEQGTRFLDVRDPKNIKQVGFYVPPRTMTWASYFVPTDKKRRVVYTLDALRGIDVLKIDRSKSNKKRTARTRSKWILEPDYKTTEGFRFQNGDLGWACRLSVPPLVPDLD